MPEGEGALTRLAAGALGLAYPAALGKGGCLALRFNAAISLRKDSLLAVNSAT
ncbi:MAG TPA: hypothetical protein VFA32_16080 [Dehalococcoidia bacterium]|nr:hypothetical protein [Dehalococcoidia bacterium]